MKRKNIAAIMLLMTVLFALSGAAQAFAEGAVGRFTVVDGRVDVLRPGKTRAEPVDINATVSAGDIVRTKSNSFAEIVFTDGAVLKISESSRIEIKDYELTGDDKRKSGLLRLLRGKIRATVPKTLGRIIPISRGPSNFEVETPTAVAGVRGTDFFVWFDRGTTGVFVLDGTVETRSSAHMENALMVGAGYFTLVHRDEEPRRVSAILNRSLIIREGENLSRHAELTEARRGKDRHGERGEDIEHLSEREIIAGGSFGRREGYDEHHTEYDSLERPVSETHTALLNTESHFSGAMSGRSTGAGTILDITSSSFTGEWEGSGIWEANLSGTFATTPACSSCSFSWIGTTSGTDSNGGTFSGSISNGTWSSGSWTADISGTKTGGSFSGTLSGTYSTSTGTVQGSGTGTWQ